MNVVGSWHSLSLLSEKFINCLVLLKLLNVKMMSGGGHSRHFQSQLNVRFT